MNLSLYICVYLCASVAIMNFNAGEPYFPFPTNGKIRAISSFVGCDPSCMPHRGSPGLSRRGSLIAELVDDPDEVVGLLGQGDHRGAAGSRQAGRTDRRFRGRRRRRPSPLPRWSPGPRCRRWPRRSRWSIPRRPCSAPVPAVPVRPPRRAGPGRPGRPRWC